MFFFNFLKYVWVSARRIVFLSPAAYEKTGKLMYTVSQKNCAKLFLPQLCQISTDFDNFWHTSRKDKLM